MATDRPIRAPDDPEPRLREAVAYFAQRDDIEAAIKALLEGGFEHSDISLLSSHESIEAAGMPGKPLGEVLTALVGEVKFLGPLADAGFIALASGPVGAMLAAVVAAGVGSVALKEVLDEVTAAPHTENFARALEAGSVILWVRVADADSERKATIILAANGGRDIHVHERPAGRE